MIQLYFIDQFNYEKVALSSHITVYGGIRIHQSIAYSHLNLTGWSRPEAMQFRSNIIMPVAPQVI